MWWPEHAERGEPVAERLRRLFADLGRAARRAARGSHRLAADLLLPPGCVLCQTAVVDPASLCITCWETIRFIERPWCERLGTPLPYDLGPGTLSSAAVADPPLFRRARSAVAYEGPIPDLVQAFKYADRTDYAPLMAAWMARAGHDLLNDADVIIPVPLHWTRLARRRFNQAALLSERLAVQSGKPHRPLALLRKKRTPQQVGLSRQSRLDNVRAAFVVPEPCKTEVTDKTVLLVDDVYTTGATLEAATRAVLKAGARQVDVLTFARVVADG